MKTQASKKLDFKKGTITELNDRQLLKINGGTGFDTRPTTSYVCTVVGQLLI